MSNADLSDKNKFFAFGGLVANGAAPSVAAGAGGDATATVTVTGKDTAGLLSVAAAGTPGTSALVCTVTFGAPLPAAPKAVTLEPANAAAAALSGNAQVFVDNATLAATSWSLKVGSSALSAGTTYLWYYQVIG